MGTSATDDPSYVINMADPADESYWQLYPRVHVEWATPRWCVEFLTLRPLLFGTAWTVLDFLLEEALAAGEAPDRGNGNWSIDRKRQRGRDGAGQPQSIGADAWQALMLTYAETSELRHSLVHRAASVDPSAQALVGHDRNGGRLRSMTTDEQEAFVRAVLRGAQIVTTAAADDRYGDDLVHQLGQLARPTSVCRGSSSSSRRTRRPRAAMCSTYRR